MVVKNTKLGGTDFSTPQDRVKPTDLNDTYDAAAGWLDRGVQEIYTGTDIDSTSTETVNHEMSEITDTAGADFLKISLTATSTAEDGTSFTNSIKPRISFQTKDIGGSYSDTMTVRDFSRFFASPAGDHGMVVTHTLSWIHTLTQDEKDNGVQVNVINAMSVVNGTGSFVNGQIVLELI